MLGRVQAAGGDGMIWELCEKCNQDACVMSKAICYNHKKNTCTGFEEKQDEEVTA